MQTQDPSDRIISLHKKAKTLLKQKLNDALIIEELRKEGIDSNYAEQILDNVFNEISDRKNFWKLIFSGAFFIIAGIVINLLSYRIASNSHSFIFYLFWGIIVVGITLLIKAFIIFRK